MEVSGQLHIPTTTPPGKEILVTTAQRLGKPQSWSAHCRKEIMLLALPGIISSSLGIHSPSIYRFCYSSSESETLALLD
jgi:hypothetical protein